MKFILYWGDKHANQTTLSTKHVLVSKLCWADKQPPQQCFNTARIYFSCPVTCPKQTGWGRLGEAQSSSHCNRWTEANRGSILTHAPTYQDRVQKKREGGGWEQWIWLLNLLSGNASCTFSSHFIGQVVGSCLTKKLRKNNRTVCWEGGRLFVLFTAPY